MKICDRPPSMGGDLLAWTACVSLDVDRHRRSCVIRTVIVVVVAIVVVAIPVVVNAVHDDHPFGRDPFPRTERADAPSRNGWPRPVVRMARDVAAADTGRRRMVVRRRTGMSMPCDSRWVGRAGRSGMMCRAVPGCRPCGMRSRGPCLLDCPWRVSARMAAGVTAPWRRACCRAECRAGDSDECEFHEVVVHNAPSLSVFEVCRRAHLALTSSKAARASFSDKPF